MPRNPVEAGEAGFLLRGILRWCAAAAALLCAASLILWKAEAGAAVFGYVSSAISFFCALLTGKEAARKKKRWMAGLILGLFLTVLLLTAGYLAAGSELAPDGVLSVAAFTMSGAMAGTLLFPSNGGKRPSRAHKKVGVKHFT